MSDNINITLSIDVPVDYVKEIRQAAPCENDTNGLLDKTIDAIKENTRMTEKNTKDFKEFFEDLEEIVRKDTEYYSTITGEGCGETAKDGFDIGDEVFFIVDGCATKSAIKDVQIKTEDGHYVNIKDIFHSMDELVEHLKESVHG